MATSAGEVEVKLSLDANSFKQMLGESQAQLQGFGSVIDQFGGRLLAVFSFAAISDFFKRSLDAYGQNELAVTRLVAALNNQGTATTTLRDHLLNLAEALQNETGVSRDSIIEAERFFTTVGIGGDTMTKAVQAALDLSTATGIDLQRAVLLLSKAYEGQTSTLSRYGIIVNKHISDSEKFTTVLDQINFRFGGAAQAQADTYTGRLNLMKTSFTELQDEVGRFLSGPASGIIKWLTDGIRSLSEFMGRVNDTTSGWHSFAMIIENVVISAFSNLAHAILAILSALAGALSHIPMVGDAFKKMQQEVNGVSAALTQNVALLRMATDTTLTNETKKQEAVLQTKTIVEQAVTVQEKTVADKMAEEMKTRSKLLADAKQGYKDFADSFVTTEGDMWKFATSLSNSFFQGVGDSFGKMVVEGKSFGESMKALWKDMTEQILSYIAQIMVKMLALYALKMAFGAGFGGAGSIAASGGGGMFGAFADGGMIGEPSVITGLRSGRQILAGESGPEMVVPMGGNKTASEMGGLPGMGGGGGGSITINISGQFIEGDSSSWNRLMRERIIPEIRRFTMSSPTSLFNRTRGVV